MDKFWKIFDRFFHAIPESMHHFIRLAAILLWLIAATVVVFIAWQSGADSATARGQDLYLSRVKENAVRERNREQAAEITIPTLQDLITDLERSDLLLPDPATMPSLGRDEQAEAADTIPIYEDQELAPFLEDDNPYAAREFLPPVDEGVPGVRDRDDRDSEMELLPLD